ncbi:hypothetical protein [Priestia filamentosa]|uniref:hypothetical protein n=1 Tax=Priestia filamentosa TaxID=1402861 RepID=UPI002E1FA2B7|nr:hypothetical protein [Priestia filamentosa]
MYFLNPPEYRIDDFYKELLENRHNNEKNGFIRTRLLSIKSVLEQAQDDYEKLGREQALHKIEDKQNIEIPDDVELDENITRKVTIKDMEKAYSTFLVDKPGSLKIGRKVYESIMSNTYYNLCPYCSHRDVKTVDHYLPKVGFALYTIIPLNLLPCCSDCNKSKLDNYVLQKDKMLIHPYFDDISNQEWLECRIVNNTWPITFHYNVGNSISDLTFKSRIEYQFELLDLSKLYADNAAREFNYRVKSLIKEYKSNPSNEALDFINSNIDTYKSENPNSWQTKMFEALKTSEWFLKCALHQLESYYRKS